MNAALEIVYEDILVNIDWLIVPRDNTSTV